MREHHRRATARRLIVACLISGLALALALPAASAAPGTKMISLSDSGGQTSKSSFGPDISKYGGAVVFDSLGDYIGTDSNGKSDVYLRTVKTSQTELVSRDKNGGLANGQSIEPAISANGRYVAFASNATDLVSARTNGLLQIYRRDLTTGQTVLASKGAKGPSDAVAHDADISANGRYVVFSSGAKNLTTKKTRGYSQIYLRDLKSKKTYLVSQNGKGAAGNGPSYEPAVSADGRFVAFQSYATNLSSKDERDYHQVFLRDRKLGKTILVSKHPRKGKAGKGGSDHPALSANGRYVVFASDAENLITWHKDNNRSTDIYRYDRVAKTMKRLSVDWKGRQLSGSSEFPDVSADGKIVVFHSWANSVAKGVSSGGYAQVYRRGSTPGTIKLVSRSWDGSQAGSGTSRYPTISANGKHVAYQSGATDLVRRPDANGVFEDIFRTGPF